MSKDPQASYYDSGGLETIEIIKAKLGPEGFAAYCRGNAIKYLCRLGFKDDPARDAQKAANYAWWLSETLNG